MTQPFNHAILTQNKIKRCINTGDRLVCGQLISHLEHQQRIERIARKNTRGTAVSWEDAAQTAHTKVFQALTAGKFRQGGVQDFYHWAAMVARLAIIDLVRKEKKQNCTSLYKTIPGTNLPLLETIPDEFNLLDTVERNDLVSRAIDAISVLDERHPSRGYKTLWSGKLKGRTQVQIAADLDLKTQSAVSKRWRELLERLAEELGFLLPTTIQAEIKTTSGKNVQRGRSTQAW
ncbi:MAG: sigma-70 family RNA polymerase sigma factor [Coleofasciculus sp. A1-SPW-01]|uniref:sigma-70 family RNA polymerase sigma factor n=1 Tax=Coleofasciculus sp. A1-SPW-01 TaxID=3070819 RepID=UPI0032F875A3